MALYVARNMTRHCGLSLPFAITAHFLVAFFTLSFSGGFGGVIVGIGPGQLGVDSLEILLELCFQFGGFFGHRF